MEKMVWTYECALIGCKEEGGRLLDFVVVRVEVNLCGCGLMSPLHHVVLQRVYLRGVLLTHNLVVLVLWGE